MVSLRINPLFSLATALRRLLDPGWVQFNHSRAILAARYGTCCYQYSVCIDFHCKLSLVLDLVEHLFGVCPDKLKAQEAGDSEDSDRCL